MALAPACELVGVKQRDYNLNHETMADTLIAVRDLIGCDGIYVSRDNWICHQALGGAMVFPENDESYGPECLLSSVSGHTELEVPSPEIAPGMETVLKAARRVVERVGERYFVVSPAAHFRGSLPRDQ